MLCGLVKTVSIYCHSGMLAYRVITQTYVEMLNVIKVESIDLALYFNVRTQVLRSCF